jgi:hypothetical protein
VASVVNLTANLRSIVSFYHQSNLFAAALRKAQVEVMGRAAHETTGLTQDVKTRWNSTFAMIKSFLEVEDAILSIIDDDEWSGSKQLVRIVLLLLDLLLYFILLPPPPSPSPLLRPVSS